MLSQIDAVKPVGEELSASDADFMWTAGKPIRVVTDNIDRVITNPNPESEFANLRAMTHGKEMFPAMRFYAA